MSDRTTATNRVATRKMTRSLRAYGGTERVNMGTTSVLEEALRDKITVICVLKPNKLVSGTIFNKRDGASPYFDVGMGFYTSTGKANFRVRNSDGDGVHAVADTSMILGAWNWLCGTYDGSAVKLYTNEELATAQPELTGNIHAANNQLGLFNFANTASSIDANIAYFAIFDYAFTQEQWNNFRLYGLLPSERPLVEYLKDHDTDGVGTTVKNTGKLGEALDGSSSAKWTTETPMKQRVALPSVMPHVLHYASGNYTTVTHNASLALGGTTPFAIDVEIAPTSNTTVQRIFAQQLEILIRTTTSATYEFIVNSLSTIDRVQAGINVPNKMTRLLCQYTGTKLQIFQDGVLAGEVSPTGTYATRTDDYIFGIGSGETFAGRQKAPKMWVNTYLTPTEIYNLHHHNIIPTPGLVGNWNRISDDGTKLFNSADPSGATDGTISGAERETETMKLGKKPKKAVVPYVGSVDITKSAGSVIVPMVLPTNGTISMRVKVKEKYNYNTLWECTGIGSDENKWEAWIPSTGIMAFRTGSNAQSCNADVANLINKWATITFVWNSGGTHYVYINGKRYGNTGVTTDSVSGENIVFGGGAVNSRGNLRISGIRMYSQALTTEEAEQLHFTNTTPYDKNKDICVLKLEAKSGQFSIDTYGDDAIWLDQSGNGNNGAMIGCSASVDVPSKARNLVTDNLLYNYNGDFTTFPAFVAKQNVGGRVISGNDGGALVGAEGDPTSEKQIFKWRCDMYQMTNGRAWYDIDSVYGPYESGVGVVLEGESVKERVNLTQGQRNYRDLNNSEDIARNLIPVKPSTNYRATIRYKCFHLANEVGDSDSYGLDVNMIGHTATGFTAHHKFNGGVIPLVQSDDFIVATLEYTTDSDELFCNPYIAIRGNSSNYADIGVAIDYIRLEEI
jgi:hypothetical protein